MILRRWVQAVFSLSEFATPEVKLTAGFSGQVETEPSPKENRSEVPVNDFELDFSEGVAFDMFGIPPCQDNEVSVYPKDKILTLPPNHIYYN